MAETNAVADHASMSQVWVSNGILRDPDVSIVNPDGETGTKKVYDIV